LGGQFVLDEGVVKPLNPNAPAAAIITLASGNGFGLARLIGNAY
jgi:hypothetical protein